MSPADKHPGLPTENTLEPISLWAKVTQRGTGVLIYGTAEALRDLQQTIWAVDDGVRPAIYGAQSGLLLGFSYEVRKAKDGYREKLKQPAPPPLLGLRHYWPYLLVTTNLLRFSAGLTPTTAQHQRQLYHLEAIIKAAINACANPYAAKLLPYIGQGIAVHTPLVAALTELLTLHFINQPATKDRLGQLPGLLQEYFSPGTATHERVKQVVEDFARTAGCPQGEVEFDGWPAKVIW